MGAHASKCAKNPPNCTTRKGPRGPRGLRGVKGKTGASGKTGARGLIGLTGAQGATGNTGAPGSAGPQGTQGVQGETGATGAAGPQGLQGVQGETGADGATGADGPQGPEGPGGPQGPPGADGPQGPIGADGPEGPAGQTGATGPANGLSEYAYIYNVIGQTIAIEADIPFDSNGIMTPGIIHAPGDPGVQFVNVGHYKVTFSVSGSEPNQMALFLNGALVQGTIYGSGAGTQQNTGQAIVAIGAGDTLTLRNHTSSSAVGLATPIGGTQGNANASLTIEKLN